MLNTRLDHPPAFLPDGAGLRVSEPAEPGRPYLASACPTVVGAKCLMLLFLFVNVGVIVGVATVALGPGRSALNAPGVVALALAISLGAWGWCVAADLKACFDAYAARPGAARPGAARPGAARLSLPRGLPRRLAAIRSVSRVACCEC